jgi:hypothetical protein
MPPPPPGEAGAQAALERLAGWVAPQGDGVAPEAVLLVAALHKSRDEVRRPAWPGLASGPLGLAGSGRALRFPHPSAASRRHVTATGAVATGSSRE